MNIRIILSNKIPNGMFPLSLSSAGFGFATLAVKLMNAQDNSKFFFLTTGRTKGIHAPRSSIACNKGHKDF
ncbi:MAG: hypothetical protein PSX81_11635 [bacterium]|nr:hypothetical protein [bacterium]